MPPPPRERARGGFPAGIAGLGVWAEGHPAGGAGLGQGGPQEKAPTDLLSAPHTVIFAWPCWPQRLSPSSLEVLYWSHCLPNALSYRALSRAL